MPPSAKSTMEVYERELPTNKLCGLGMQGYIYIYGKWKQANVAQGAKQPLE